MRQAPLTLAEALSKTEPRQAAHAGRSPVGLSADAWLRCTWRRHIPEASLRLRACCHCVQEWVHVQGTEYPPPPHLKKELIATVREEIGPIATPDVIHWAPGQCLPQHSFPMHKLPLCMSDVQRPAGCHMPYLCAVTVAL